MWISRKALAEERERDRQLLLEVVKEITTAMGRVTGAMSELVAVQQAHLAMFAVAEAPEGHTVRDEDELLAEIERRRLLEMKLFGES